MKQQTTTPLPSSGPMWQRLEACVREQVQQFIKVTPALLDWIIMEHLQHGASVQEHVYPHG